MHIQKHCQIGCASWKCLILFFFFASTLLKIFILYPRGTITWSVLIKQYKWSRFLQSNLLHKTLSFHLRFNKMSFQSYIVHVIIMHKRFVYEAHKQISTSCVHPSVEIIKRTIGHSIQVLNLCWLWKHSSDQQAGIKHVIVVGRYDTTGPLADLWLHSTCW